MKTSKFFTLIELLVVISIIVLLMCILLPAFARAKETGRQIKCNGNLKQLGVAFTMYSMDFNSCLPASLDASFRWWCRDDVLGSYFGYFKPGGGIMRCPSHPVVPYDHRLSNYTMNKYGSLRSLNRISSPSLALLLADSTYADTIQFDDNGATFYLDRVAIKRHVNCTNGLFVDGHSAKQMGLGITEVKQGW